MTAPTLPTGISIRTRFADTDPEAILKLHQEVYASEYGYGPAFFHYVEEGLEEFSRRFDPASDGCWLCEHNGTIVGSLILMHREPHVYQLRFFVLSPAFRGKGLGHVLLRQGFDFLSAQNARAVFLWTTAEQHTAAALYRKYGFILTAEKETVSMGKTLKEQKYERRLS
ncbi:GNAT family N-acetyltransferase [Niabella beijingensis]|uniref:GNAT family N-acetyltransferase n=1 Tax=Niabella beijingensis TaxID=2872700 RepID=UPI001CC16706|nr:GNAT family N-acetyltransferase [Niabella beijingensis]MBZ4191217.1 GNAT family N-acetyltransferase [Niabella beijingensis]